MFSQMLQKCCGDCLVHSLKIVFDFRKTLESNDPKTIAIMQEMLLISKGTYQGT